LKKNTEVTFISKKNSIMLNMGDKSDINKIVKDFLEVQSDCIKEIKEHSETIDKIIKIIISTKNRNKTIFTMGNGGSG